MHSGETDDAHVGDLLSLIVSAREISAFLSSSK